MQIFISYSSKDNIEAFQVCEYLEKNGVSCFIAPRNIQPGKEYGEEIVNGIDGSKAMVLLLSGNSNRSPHVLREVERAVSKGIPIYVCCLEQVELTKSMEYFLMTHQWGNMSGKPDYTKILEWIHTLEEARTPMAGERRSGLVKIQESGKGKKKSMDLKLAGVGIGLLVVLVLMLLLCIGVFWQENTKGPIEVAPGDIITLGSYNGERIEWRVLKIEDEQAVLVAKNILTMKAYDVAESGMYNYIGQTSYWNEPLTEDMETQVQVRGNSDWSVSNIRTWLNSDKEVVSYKDQAPVGSAMSEHRNGYDKEAGFLYGFTLEELAAIVETQVRTNTNGMAQEETILTADKVYLLSLEELQWFVDAGISMFTKPTEAAVNQDKSGWYLVEKEAYGVEEYYWWLREPVANIACKCYMVGNGYWEETTLSSNVGGEGFGIRPAITVDLTSDYLWDLYGTDK